MSPTTNIVRTDSDHQDFIGLVRLLDAELAVRDGDEHAFYARYNKIESIGYVVVAYENEKPVGCGALKEYSTSTMEIKRMYVLPDGRRRGIASRILMELENWAKELSYSKCILETGKRQPEAIQLYTRSGYTLTPNYGQYVGMDNSVCFEKNIK